MGEEHHDEHQKLTPPKLTPNKKFGMGHIPPKAWPTGHTFSVRHLFGASNATYPSSEMRMLDFVDRIRNQQRSSACVGFANARVIHVRAQALLADHPDKWVPEYPSELGIYDMAREEDLYGPEGVLFDMGSDPALAIQALEKRGVPRESSLPFPECDATGNPIDPRAFATRMPFDVLEEAADYKVTGVGLLDGDDPNQVANDSKVLLSSFQPFAIAIQVDEAFENYDGTKVLGPPQGHIYGGHDICILAYEGDYAWGINQWGINWGYRGLFKMSWQGVAAATSRYFPQALPIWPTGAPKAGKVVA